MKAFLLSSIALFLMPNLLMAEKAAAQIDMSELGNAAAYEPGTLNAGTGGLSNNLWSGTSMGTAEELIKDLPGQFSNSIARNLTRAALLSAGVPPEGGSNADFQLTRIKAIIAMSEMAGAQDILQRTPELASSRQLKADMALLSGDSTGTCALSDSIMDARSEPYWMKLRAFCHVERNEIAAAELTLDLLRSSGDDDNTFQTLMRQLMAIPGKPNLKDMRIDPLSIAMMDKAALDWPSGELPPSAAARRALNPASSPDKRLAALFLAGNALSDSQISQTIDSLAATSNNISEGLAGGFAGLPVEPNLEMALGEKTPRSFNQLYTLAQTGNPDTRVRAVTAILRRAKEAGAFDRFVKFLEPQYRTLSIGQAALSDLPILTQAAISLSDLSALQQIHGLLDGNPAQDRVALAADALGNGFYAGSLGVDIDSRLRKSGSTKSRALRDALLAHALGAQLSETALEVLQKKANMGQFSGQLLALQSASAKRAQAETALRAALLLEKSTRLSDIQIFQLVTSLYKAGLTDFAAKLAAQDFLSDFKD